LTFPCARAELIAERAEKELRACSAPIAGRGVQAVLNAALQHNPVLGNVIRLLSVRRNEGVEAVKLCLKGLYHELSAGFHTTSNAVIVRELDFAVATTRCALCALLETYDIPYMYYNSAEEVVDSPYVLSAEERAAAAVATS
jgi:hypothetical protein